MSGKRNGSSLSRGPRHGLRFSVGEQSCVKVVAAGDGTKTSYDHKNETKSRTLRHCLDGAARRLGAIDPDVARFVHDPQKDPGIKNSTRPPDLRSAHLSP